jgi:hypothetical protein
MLCSEGGGRTETISAVVVLERNGALVVSYAGVSVF